MKQSLEYADLQTLNCRRSELDPTHSVDDYAKDGGPEEVRLFYVVSTMILCAR